MANLPAMEGLRDYRRYSDAEAIARVQDFTADLRRRRTVRDFAADPVPRAIIEAALLAAGSAPSGANQQPWHFCVITDPALKRRVREGAEAEEREFYNGRASAEWLEALAPLGTDADKPFLETAPVLIAIFAQRYGIAADGSHRKHYYVPESVGISTGFLIAALHHAGLATLTHTPSPMNFLNRLCQRPEHEKPYILLVAGYPAKDAQVPVYGGRKKSLGEFTSWL
ncbi:nitroreductase family protein [Ferrovibrio sp.]|uniref:nitroreductase family protein n=1 Tax=Ferrovibrio sp. TaxID=1917215 RepID=UPI0035B0A102